MSEHPDVPLSPPRVRIIEGPDIDPGAAIAMATEGLFNKPNRKQLIEQRMLAAYEKEQLANTSHLEDSILDYEMAIGPIDLAGIDMTESEDRSSSPLTPPIEDSPPRPNYANYFRGPPQVRKPRPLSDIGA
jgi:hypothetical protein